MLEPAVTLTDYGLTIECWLFAVLILRAKQTELSRWWTLFFVSIGTASLLGGTVHGFLPDTSVLASRIVWNANLIAIGCTALATWILGALLTESVTLRQWVPRIATVLLAAFIVVVVFVSNRFVVAIAMYLPATLFLTVTMVMAHIATPGRGWAVGIVGLALTYAAAAVQQLKFGLHPVYFDHNAFFHAIQAVALYLLFLAQSKANRFAGAVSTSSAG
jgi:hypothetical protein